MGERGGALVKVLALVGIAAGCALLFGPWLLRLHAASAFSSQIKFYSEIRYARSAASVAEGAMPYRTGKVVVLRSVETGTSGDLVLGKLGFAGLWHRLPEGMRAKTPAEVDTLIRTSIGTSDHPPYDYVMVNAYDLRGKLRIGTHSRPYAKGKEDPEKVLEDLIRGMELRP